MMNEGGEDVASTASAGFVTLGTVLPVRGATGDPAGATVALVVFGLVTNWSGLVSVALGAANWLATRVAAGSSGRNGSHSSSGNGNAGGGRGDDEHAGPKRSDGQGHPAGSGSGAGDRSREVEEDLPYRGGHPGDGRHDDADALDNGVRRMIYGHVRRSPGTYPAKVVGATGVPLSTVRYHLRVLLEDGLVEEETIGGRRRLYPAGSDHLALAAALEDEATASVLRALARSGPATVSDLAERVDRAPSTLSHHLSRLEDEGLVVREREGVSVVTRLDPAVRDELDAREGSADERTTAEG